MRMEADMVQHGFVFMKEVEMIEHCFHKSPEKKDKLIQILRLFPEFGILCTRPSAFPEVAGETSDVSQC